MGGAGGILFYVWIIWGVPKYGKVKVVNKDV